MLPSCQRRGTCTPTKHDAPAARRGDDGLDVVGRDGAVRPEVDRRRVRRGPSAQAAHDGGRGRELAADLGVHGGARARGRGGGSRRCRARSSHRRPARPGARTLAAVAARRTPRAAGEGSAPPRPAHPSATAALRGVARARSPPAHPPGPPPCRPTAQRRPWRVAVRPVRGRLSDGTVSAITIADNRRRSTHAERDDGSRPGYPQHAHQRSQPRRAGQGSRSTGRTPPRRPRCTSEAQQVDLPQGERQLAAEHEYRPMVKVEPVGPASDGHRATTGTGARRAPRPLRVAATITTAASTPTRRNPPCR